MIGGFVSSAQQVHVYSVDVRTHIREPLAVVLVLARCRQKPSCGRVLEVCHRVIGVDDDIGDDPHRDRTGDPLLSYSQAPCLANGRTRVGSGLTSQSKSMLFSVWCPLFRRARRM